MNKTGCTHIAKLLAELFDGEQLRKHNTATEEQINSDRYFISSIRNPWDWYLSLWTFGVQGDGSLVKRLTRRNLFKPLISIIINPKKKYAKLLDRLSRNVALWRDVYDSPDSVASFRKWLMLIHDPSNSHWLEEGYGDTEITNLCGFMTYRYLNLCCSRARELSNPDLISSYTDLVQFENNNCYIDYFIKQESLEDDFCEVVEKLRPLSQEEKDLIYGSNKTNTSKRSLLISEYYDEESIELVRNRDRLLIDKFNYSPPK
jgi:hypothetical protein